jgi:hypothetical protein
MASITIRARSFLRQDVLKLYRQCLVHVRVFPSVKREALYHDIRAGSSAAPKLQSACRPELGAEFRKNATLTDPDAIAHAVEVAMRGIMTMRKYTRESDGPALDSPLKACAELDEEDGDWHLEMEQDPLGQAAHEQRKAEGEEELKRRVQAGEEVDLGAPDTRTPEDLHREAQALLSELEKQGTSVWRVPRDDDA